MATMSYMFILTLFIMISGSTGRFPNEKEIHGLISLLLNTQSTETETSHHFDPQLSYLHVPISSHNGHLPLNYHYFSPRFLLWDVMSRFPFLQTSLYCPVCENSGRKTKLRQSGKWQDGSRRNSDPRILFDKDWYVFLVSHVYICENNHQVLAHDPAVLQAVPSPDWIPFFLSHQHGITRSALNTVVQLCSEGLRFSSIEKHFTTTYSQYLSHQEINYWNAIHTYDHFFYGPIPRNVGFPAITEFPNIGRNYLERCCLQHFRMDESRYVKSMCSLGTNKWLSCFRVSGNTGNFKKENKSWVTVYNSLFIVMNDDGQVIGWMFTQGDNLEELRTLFEGLRERLNRQMCNWNAIVVEECCALRGHFEMLFGPGLQVKLDLAHAIQSVTAKIPKHNQHHNQCASDFAMVFRAADDGGQQRMLATPDPGTLLANLGRFVEKWNNVKNTTGAEVLNSSVVKEIQNIRMHIMQGCLSFIPPRMSINHGERLQKKLKNLLHSSRLGMELAHALFTVLFHSHNIETSETFRVYPIYMDKTKEMKTYVLATNGTTVPDPNPQNPSELFGLRINKVFHTQDEIMQFNKLSTFDINFGLAAIDDHLNRALASGSVDQDLPSKVNMVRTSLLVWKACKLMERLWGTCLSSLTQFLSALLNQQGIIPRVITSLNTGYEQTLYGSSYDSRLDGILRNWGLERVPIAGDGDCLFRSVAIQVQTVLATDQTHTVSQVLMAAGLTAHSSVEEIISALRTLVVTEFMGDYQNEYQAFLTGVDVHIEAPRFLTNGYFNSDLGDVIVLALSNVLRTHVIIFQSSPGLEMLPVIPSHTTVDSTSNFLILLSYNPTGVGHYELVRGKQTTEVIAPPKPRPPPAEGKSCRCGINDKVKVPRCNKSAKKSVGRCCCIRANKLCTDHCSCVMCGNRDPTDTTVQESQPVKQRRIQQVIKRKRRRHLLSANKHNLNHNVEMLGKPLHLGSLNLFEDILLAVVLVHIVHPSSMSEPSVPELVVNMYLAVVEMCLSINSVSIPVRKKSFQTILDAVKKLINYRNHLKDIIEKFYPNNSS